MGTLRVKKSRIIWTRFEKLEDFHGTCSVEKDRDAGDNVRPRGLEVHSTGGSRMFKGLYEAHLPVSDIDKSVEFYKNLGLEQAYQGPRVTFFWIEKGKSWLGLWPSEHANTPYHPSIRHVAFYVELEDLKRAQEWLKNRGIEVRDAFGVAGEDQPLILQNGANYHAAIYFNDPDGNSLEFITPLSLDTTDVVYHDGMTLSEWFAANNM